MKGYADDVGDANSSDGDYSDDGDEGHDEYKVGGYHPVHVGDCYHSRYIVLDKLGWGHFSTVWLCYDKKRGTTGISTSNTVAITNDSSQINSNRLVALKIQKSASHYRDAAYDEIELLKTTTSMQSSSSFIQEHGRGSDCKVVTLLDNFEHIGPHGRHVCMVFEVLGENLLQVIKRYNYRGIPIPIVKRFAHQVLLGLDFLHRHCSMIHTDLKVFYMFSYTIITVLSIYVFSRRIFLCLGNLA